MKSLLFRLFQYLRYVLEAKGRHGTHSPFVYHLAEQVIPKSLNEQPVAFIEKVHEELKKNKQSIEIIDFKSKTSSTKQIRQHVKSSTSTLKFRKLLKELCEELEVERVVETGTSFGISAAYMAQAESVKTVHTIEGNANIQEVAKTHFGNIDTITFHKGDVHEIFPQLVKEVVPELVFLDADHRGTTVDFYLNALTPIMNDIKAIIIHDIFWSQDMQAAWIKHYKNYPIAVDIFQAGILFPNIVTPNQQFRLKF